MEIICAGYPKTGSKSCSDALRELGYTVADYPETAEYLGYQWTDFIDGKIGIESVIEEYKKQGFQANQDMPGNVLWEKLYHASPNAKVILTVRDSEKQWKNSFINFVRHEYERLGNPAYWMLKTMSYYGIMGPKMHMIDNFENLVLSNVMIGFDPMARFWTWQAAIEYFSTV